MLSDDQLKNIIKCHEEVSIFDLKPESQQRIFDEAAEMANELLEMRNNINLIVRELWPEA